MEKLLLLIGILLFSVSVDAQPTINDNPYPLIECDVNNDGFAYFDLHLADADINLGDTSLNLSYHINMTDAASNINALISPYLNEVPYSQVVFARAHDPGTDLFAIVELELRVVQNLPITQPMDLFLVDENEDGFEVFDLTVNNTIVLEELNPVLYMISYYESEANAEDGEYSIANPTSYYNMQNPQTIYVRIDNLSGSCTAITSFTISVGALSTASLIFENLNIFPNPTSGSVTIQSSQLVSVTTISLYDILGQLLFAKTFHPQNGIVTLDVSSFSEGIYFVKISSEGNEAVRKFIKK